MAAVLGEIIGVWGGGLAYVGEVVNRYKGFSGAVLSIDTHKDDSRHLVAGCGLDRYLRVFNVDPPDTQHQVSVCVCVCVCVCACTCEGEGEIF